MSDEIAKSNDEELEVVIEGEETQVDDVVEHDESGEDERAVDSEHDDDDHQEDAGEDENERESLRERRRQERLLKKQRAREREDTLRRELAARDAVIAQMQEKLGLIERKTSSQEVAQLQAAKNQAVQAYNHFKEQVRLGVEAGNGAAYVEAQERMMQAGQRIQQLENIERAYKQNQSAPQPLDPRLANHAQDWMSRNKWYDPTARDADSRITMTIDQQLAEEGWNPTTKEYWDELDARVKKYLPHRQNGGKSTSTRPKSVVAGSGREGGGASGKSTYTLSRERKEAIIQAGAWDDPQARAAMIKAYRDYDKQNG